jgi:RHS repeat-associated protein
LNLDGSTRWTNNLTYDNGVAAGPGVLTQMGQGSALWNGVADTFSRVTTETNNMVSYSAYGHVNGQSTLSAWLDNKPVSVTAVGTNAMQWQSLMELNAGSHQLKVAAFHPSGFYTAWATNSFTNNIAYLTTTNSFDGAGNVTQRIWRKANGTTNRIQTLAWDARGRLHYVTDRDASQNGQNFIIVYDALGRRLQTTETIVSNGVALASLPIVVAHCFDPLYEFLELGESERGGSTTFKLLGPDLDGTYGGENGMGGFEGTSPYLNQFYPTIADFNGNILGGVTNGVVCWNSSRLTAYGAVPDYRPPTLGSSGDLASKYASRNRAMESIGLVWQGANWYDPVTGQWLSPDSAGHPVNPTLYGYCAGNPLNLPDSDGRFGKQVYQTSIRQATTAAAWADDTVINMVAGTGVVVDRAAGGTMQLLGAAPSNYYLQANRYQSLMSPYARAGYYNPATPTAQLATAATIFVAPESLAGRAGMLESAVTRDVVANNVSRTGTQLEFSFVNNLPRIANPTAELPISQVQNFSGGFASKNIFSEGTTLYGVRDVTSRQVWWSRTRPIGELFWRQESVVLPSWNAGTHIDILTIPERNSLIGYEGLASPISAGNFGGGWYFGKGNQIYIENVPANWINRMEWK